MDLADLLGEAVTALKAPLEQADREQGWTDDLRREIQEEISVHRSALQPAWTLDGRVPTPEPR